MTAEEAKIIIQKHDRCDDADYDGYCRKTLCAECENFVGFGNYAMALKVRDDAIERMISKKPTFSFEMFSCPSCYHMFGKKNSKAIRHCPNCGQKIDWS